MEDFAGEKEENKRYPELQGEKLCSVTDKCVHARACVCTCVRERERERERASFRDTPIRE